MLPNLAGACKLSTSSVEKHSVYLRLQLLLKWQKWTVLINIVLQSHSTGSQTTSYRNLERLEATQHLTGSSWTHLVDHVMTVSAVSYALLLKHSFVLRCEALKVIWDILKEYTTSHVSTCSVHKHKHRSSICSGASYEHCYQIKDLISSDLIGLQIQRQTIKHIVLWSFRRTKLFCPKKQYLKLVSWLGYTFRAFNKTGLNKVCTCHQCVNSILKKEIRLCASF